MDMELEGYLRPPEYPMAPYPAKVVTLATSAKPVSYTHLTLPTILLV